MTAVVVCVQAPVPCQYHHGVTHSKWSGVHTVHTVCIHTTRRRAWGQAAVEPLAQAGALTLQVPEELGLGKHWTSFAPQGLVALHLESTQNSLVRQALLASQPPQNLGSEVVSCTVRPGSRSRCHQKSPHRCGPHEHADTVTGPRLAGWCRSQATANNLS